MKIYETKQTYGYSTKVLILTYNFKNIKAMRVKEKLRKWSRWNETKEIWLLNAAHDSKLDFFAIKDIIRAFGKWGLKIR